MNTEDTKIRTRDARPTATPAAARAATKRARIPFRELLNAHAEHAKGAKATYHARAPTTAKRASAKAAPDGHAPAREQGVTRGQDRRGRQGPVREDSPRGNAADDRRRDDRIDDSEAARAEDASLAAFQPPPAVLFAPSAQMGAPTPRVAGSAAAHAETAAMADRLLDTLRVGRSADGGHQVRMRLAPSSRFAGVEVRLEEHGGVLSAVLMAAPGADERAADLAEQIVRELRSRGLELEDVEIERA